MNVVEIDELGFTYGGARRPALERVCLSIEPGEFVVLAGGSGSGKSTLLAAISGLVPHFHGGEISGEVRVCGLSTREAGPSELAAHVGTMFQDPESGVILGTARAELAFPLENRGWSAAAIARSVEETSLALAIERLLDRSTSQLSGGELQRLALGATIAGRPAIVCLDEPTSQLDPVAGDELIAVLHRLNEDFELTVVLAEHRLERCLPAAGRVLALDAGALVFDGPADEFLGWALDHNPALATPGARLLSELGIKPVAGVRAARAALRDAGHDPPGIATGPHGIATASVDIATPPPGTCPADAARRARATPDAGPALVFHRVWHELTNGPSILRSVSLSLGRGERVALMGANGAGKSTLLRHAAGLLAPTRGAVETAGRVALLLQNPNDYLVHDRVADEAPRGALARFGLLELADRHPRDLSGGERQRLALAIVLGDPDSGERPPVICLDEPTRGMDRADKHALALLLCQIGSALLVATHDPEFVAEFAQRVVLLARGRVIADGSAAEILSGGTYFATETARIVGGVGGALLADEGAAALRSISARRHSIGGPPIATIGAAGTDAGAVSVEIADRR